MSQRNSNYTRMDQVERTASNIINRFQQGGML